MATVRFLTARKGSNPGGKVLVDVGSVLAGSNSTNRGNISYDNRHQNGTKNGNGPFEAYLKYCLTQRGKASPFRAEHQPAYEAATFQLAKLFGLHVPNSYVLLDEEKTLVFEGCRDVGEPDPSGRRIFFVSKWLDCATDRSGTAENLVNGIVHIERPYLDALHVSDVIGRRQNFIFCDDGKSPSVNYVDLGCSFVHASKGMLTLPTKTKIVSDRQLKIAERRLARYAVISADETKVVDLAELPQFIKMMRIPTLNPSGSVLLSSLVNPQEHQEMEKDIVYTAYTHLDDLNAANVLIKK
jgi:hypothetical protein